MGIYCTVFYHQQQVMRFFQLLPFITTLCSNETLSCKNPLLAVGNKTQCSKYPLQLASGFITDLFTKIDRPIKKTDEICNGHYTPKLLERTKQAVCTILYKSNFHALFSYLFRNEKSVGKIYGIKIDKFTSFLLC